MGLASGLLYVNSVNRNQPGASALTGDLRITDDTASALAGEPVSIKIAENDNGEADVSTYAVAIPPEHGTLGAFDPEAGTIVYTPEAGFEGEDTFIYTVDEIPGPLFRPEQLATGTSADGAADPVWAVSSGFKKKDQTPAEVRGNGWICKSGCSSGEGSAAGSGKKADDKKKGNSEGSESGKSVVFTGSFQVVDQWQADHLGLALDVHSDGTIQSIRINGENVKFKRKSGDSCEKCDAHLYVSGFGSESGPAFVPGVNTVQVMVKPANGSAAIEVTPGNGGDNDGDGVDDIADRCPGSPADVPVNSSGCRREQGLVTLTVAAPVAASPASSSIAPTSTTTTTVAPMATTTTAAPATSTTTTTVPQCTDLINASFETPAIGNRSWIIRKDSTVPGWSSTSGELEFWKDGFQGIAAPDGRQFVELNANRPGTFYQDVSTAPGEVLTWSFAHRGRTGVDVIRLLIGPSTATDEPGLTSQGDFATDRTAWQVYTGSYTVPAGQTSTRFAWKSVSSANGRLSYGNLLDAVSFARKGCNPVPVGAVTASPATTTVAPTTTSTTTTSTTTTVAPTTTSTTTTVAPTTTSTTTIVPTTTATITLMPQVIALGSSAAGRPGLVPAQVRKVRGTHPKYGTPLGGIFTGTDSLGLPAIPGGPQVECLQDLSSGVYVDNTEGILPCSVPHSDPRGKVGSWVVYDGWLKIPQGVKNIDLIATNSGKDGTYRANFYSVWFSTSTDKSTLGEVGSAWTAYKNPSAVTFGIPLPASQCAVPTAFPFRVYWYDNGWKGATNLKWSVDGGKTTDIPAANISAAPGAVLPGLDTDEDGILDSVEVQPPAIGGAVPYDTDADGIPDCEDLDSDSDGVLDAVDPNRTEPSAADDFVDGTVTATSVVDVVSNDDAAANGGTVSVTVLSNSGGGSTSVDPSTGAISYMPVAGDAGTTVTMPYEVCVDGAAACARATLFLSVAASTVPTTTTTAPAPPPTTAPSPTAVPTSTTTVPMAATTTTTIPGPFLSPTTTTQLILIPPTVGPAAAPTTTTPTTTTTTVFPIAPSTITSTTLPFVDTDGDGIPDSSDPTPIVDSTVNLLSIKRQTTAVGDTLNLVVEGGNQGRDTARATSLVVDPIRGAHIDTWSFGSWHLADGSTPASGAGTVFVGAEPTCYLDSGTLRCGLGDVVPGWVVDATVTYVTNSNSATLQAGASVTSAGFDTDLGNNVTQLAVEGESVLRRILPNSLAFTGVRFGLQWWFLSAILLLSIGGGFILLGSKRRRDVSS